ncbi:MAG: M23 family metallopeptidase, partial [Nitrospinae bacterium]|nr:M23 family metallopeptidase [Nitrospinota bacterium]
MILTIILSLSLLAGCGGGGSNEPGGSTTSSTSTWKLSGVVTKGPVNSATVYVYDINDDGTRGDIVAGPVKTNSEGLWEVSISSDIILPLEVVASGGSFIDEATGEVETFESSDELTTIVPVGVTEVAVTPITSATAIGIKEYVANTVSESVQSKDSFIQKAKTKSNIKAAVTDVTNNISALYGFNPVETIPPSKVTSSATESQNKYIAILGGFCKLLKDPSTAAIRTGKKYGEVMSTFVKDLADGLIDGKGINENDIPEMRGISMSNVPPLDTLSTTFAIDKNIKLSDPIAINTTISETDTTGVTDENLGKMLLKENYTKVSQEYNVYYEGGPVGDKTANAKPTASAVSDTTSSHTDGTLSATGGNGEVSLNWSGFPDSSGRSTDYKYKYKLVYSESQLSSCSRGTQIYSGTDTIFTHTHLTNDTTYYYRVCATGGWHPGIDYSARTPLDVYSPVKGTVTGSSAVPAIDKTKYGRVSIKIDGTNEYFIFLHLSLYYVKQGDQIEINQKIGKTGAVGTETPHLHVEART